jgi:hypothetical protein
MRSTTSHSPPSRGTDTVTPNTSTCLEKVGRLSGGTRIQAPPQWTRQFYLDPAPPLLTTPTYTTPPTSRTGSHSKSSWHKPGPSNACIRNSHLPASL